MNDDDLRNRLNRAFGEPPAAQPDELARIVSTASATPLHLWIVAAASLAFAIAVVTLVSPPESRSVSPIGEVTDPYDQSLDGHRQLALAIVRSRSR